MIGARDDDALGVADALHDLLQLVHVAVLVLRPVKEQHGLLAVTQISEVVFVDGRADEEDRVDVLHFTRSAAGHPRPEREAPGEDAFAGMLLPGPVERGEEVP